jgi:hypothetical protein
MKIKIEFDSLEEMLRHVNLAGGITTTFTDFSPEEIERIQKAREAQTAAEAPVAEPADAPEQKPTKTKKDTPEAKAPEKATESPTEGKTPTEEDRVSVRKALAKLNKLTGKNVAREILEDMGYDKLTEVPLERLAELMEKAKEAYHAE